LCGGAKRGPYKKKEGVKQNGNTVKTTKVCHPLSHQKNEGKTVKKKRKRNEFVNKVKPFETAGGPSFKRKPEGR